MNRRQPGEAVLRSGLASKEATARAINMPPDSDVADPGARNEGPVWEGRPLLH
jgi:hypothetical protein